METTPKNKFMPVGKSKLIEGTIITPELANLCLVVVPVSMMGKPENSVYGILEKKWKNVKADVKGWHASNRDFKLGDIHELCVQSDVWVVSILCLDKEGVLDEKALAKCMKNLLKMTKDEKASVHISMITVDEMPQIGDLVQEHLLDNGVNVYFYQEKDKQ